ncbi:MAG: hypothetical protein LH632_20510 [Rhodoferax sp.]|nr:hypothetical protein [Rhodoferax sp.]
MSGVRPNAIPILEGGMGLNDLACASSGRRRPRIDGQGGLQIYLDDSALGPALWDAVWHSAEVLARHAESPGL